MPPIAYRSRDFRLAYHAGILLTLLMMPSGGLAQDLGTDLKPFTLTGSLIASAENSSPLRVFGGSRGWLDTERPPNTARLYFNPTISIYGLQLPFSLVLSTNERTYNQPFNQFGVSPKYKWFTGHAGYRSLYVSEFSLADAVIFGGGAEVKTDWFHTKGMYGRFRRNVDEDSVRMTRAVYTRMGFAVTAGLGSEQNFIDFNFLRAWDDTLSLKQKPTFGEVYPEENLVAGTLGRFTMADGQLVLDGEWSGSFLTRDQRQPLVKDRSVATFSQGAIDARLSTRFNMAYKAALTFNEDLYTIRGEFARVEPEYETMGASYTVNDRQDITLAPSFRLPDGTLRVGGSIGFRSDNLFDDKGFTTRRVISSASVNWAPSALFGMDGTYSNYSMSNSSATYQVSDSTRVQNVSESFSLSPRLLISGEAMQHFILLFATRQAYSDENILTGTQSDNDVLTAVLSYTGSLAVGLGFSGAFQFTEISTAFYKSIIRGYTVGVNNSFLDNTLQANLSYSLNLTRSSADGDADSQHLISIDGRYRITGRDALELRFQFNTYDAANPNRRSYEGTTTRLQYSRSFRFETP